MKPDLDANQLAQILIRLNGVVQPVGETNADDARFEDLIRLEKTIDILLDEIYFVCKCADHYEFSRKRAGNQATAWLAEKKEWITDILNEQGVSEAIANGIPCEEKPQGEWVFADDELPQDMQSVLIWFEYYRYGDFNCMYQTHGFGYVCDGKWSPFINGETGWQDYRVIAWQPLPEPYKKGDKQ